MTDPKLLQYVERLERERDSYRDSYRYWKGRLNDGTYIDGQETHVMCFDRVLAERDRLRDALAVIDSGAHAPESGPPEWEEYATYVQVVAGSALGRVG